MARTSESANGGLPSACEIPWRSCAEAQPRWLRFMRGDLDIVVPDKDNYDSALPGGRLSPKMKKMGVQYQR